jgi:hypothetical protein
MNKKKSFIFFIILVFIVCCFMTIGSWAAKKTDFYKSNAKDFIRKLNENKGFGNAFGFTTDEDFVLIRQVTDFNRETHYRYQQTFNGYPVWGIQAVISKKAGKVIKLHGAVIQDSKNDIGSIPKKLDAPGALREMQEKHKAQDAGAVWNFENETYGTGILCLMLFLHFWFPFLPITSAVNRPSRFSLSMPKTIKSSTLLIC